MSEWNSAQYLKFKNQRTQPSVDLAKRIKIDCAKNIVDIGCGPGNSTHILKTVFNNADILGIDSSKNMIESAKSAYPDINFMLLDAGDFVKNDKKYDIVFSNACLQWIPKHEEFIPLLFGKLNKGGVLAVQMPINFNEPLFKIIDETVKNKKWNLTDVNEPNETLAPDKYFDILSSLTNDFDIWETVYYHNMSSLDDMIEWVKGTRLRPYLNKLNQNLQDELIKEIYSKALPFYKKQTNGEIIFKFRRLFFTAKNV